MWRNNTFSDYYVIASFLFQCSFYFSISMWPGTPFATMMLTLGADLYTTSKLLGHADVKMTQVYAKIINQKKDDAVNLVNGLFD